MASFFDRIFKRNKESALVLMYHRIADATMDPWDLCVSPENFRQQVEFLKRNFQIVTMHELAGRIRVGKAIRDLAVLTFDDGYLDNYTVAKSILEKYGVPATFYFTAKFQSSYWWDELEQIVLTTPELPEELVIDLAEEKFIFDLGETSRLTSTLKEEVSRWRYGDPHHNSRISLFFELWSRIRPMPPAARQETIRSLKEWAGVRESNTPALMSETQAKEMAEVPMFEIGAHTVNHPALGLLPKEEQRNEIQKSKSILEKITGKSLRGFAYPHGSVNEDTPAITQASGFDYAVSTREQSATRRSPLYDLPRFQVKNMNGAAFENTVKAWQRNSV
jgi:peptidoglycan/xylan/chitin deacetylase (PgdA/CDA1 family)